MSELLIFQESLKTNYFYVFFTYIQNFGVSFRGLRGAPPPLFFGMLFSNTWGTIETKKNENRKFAYFPLNCRHVSSFRDFYFRDFSSIYSNYASRVLHKLKVSVVTTIKLAKGKRVAIHFLQFLSYLRYFGRLILLKSAFPYKRSALQVRECIQGTRWRFLIPFPKKRPL